MAARDRGSVSRRLNGRLPLGGGALGQELVHGGAAGPVAQHAAGRPVVLAAPLEQQLADAVAEAAQQGWRRVSAVGE